MAFHNSAGCVQSHDLMKWLEVILCLLYVHVAI